MIFNIAVAGKRKVAVTVYGAPSETVTITDGTNTYTVTTDSHGIGTTTPEVKFGTYTVSGTKSATVSGFASGRSVTVAKSTTTVTAYPPGALYWLGNGDASGDALYGICGGVSGATAINADNFTTYILSGSNSLYSKTATTGSALSMPAGKMLKLYWNSPYEYEEYYIDGQWKYHRAYGVAGITGGASVSPTSGGTRVSSISIASAVTASLFMTAYAQGGTGNTSATCTMYAIWLE